MVIKTYFFDKKLKILCSLNHTILFNFHKHMVQIFLKECMEGLPMSALATVARKSFNGKFTAKFDFPISGSLCYHC